MGAGLGLPPILIFLLCIWIGCGEVLPKNDSDTPADGGGQGDGGGSGDGDGGPDAADPCIDVAAEGCELFTCEGSSSCYRLCSEEVDFATATELCAPDGKVIETETRAELDCAHAHNLSSIWIGLAQDGTAVEVDQGWTWQATGQAPAQTHWGDNEPSDADGSENGYEQCAIVQITTGEWSDIVCEDAIASVACEIDPN